MAWQGSWGHEALRGPEEDGSWAPLWTKRSWGVGTVIRHRQLGAGEVSRAVLRGGQEAPPSP